MKRSNRKVRSNSEKIGSSVKDEATKKEDRDRMKGKKPNNKGNRTNRDNKVAEPRNDVSWYINSDEMKRLVANISYDYRLGHTLNVVPGNARVESFDWQLPGILEVDFTPTYGDSSGIDSPLNIACSEVAAFIRKNIRTTIPYSPNTVGLFLIVMDSIYMRMLALGRALVTANKYSVFNKYVPDSLVVAMGYDPVDLRANYDKYIMEYNFLVQTINTIYVPDLFKFINRHQYLCANIFADSERENAQLYLPMPTIYYDIAYGVAASPEDTIPVAAISKPFRRYLQILNLDIGDMSSRFLFDLNAIKDTVAKFKDNEDFQKIMSDMLNAYGNASHVQLPMLTPFQVVAPVVNNEWNLQMHNSMAAGYPIYYMANELEPTSNIRDCTAIYEFISQGNDAVYGYLVSKCTTFKRDFRDNDTSPMFANESFDSIFDVTTAWSGDLDTVVEGTRLTYAWATSHTCYFAGDREALQIHGIGSEVVAAYRIIHGYYRDENDMPRCYEKAFTNSFSMGNLDSHLDRLQILSDLSTFTWTPIIYLFSSTAQDFYPFGNIELRAKLSKDMRRNLNETAIRAMFNYGNLIAGATST